jgi:F420-dependent hydroxymycolic acid dehydrogenase
LDRQIRDWPTSTDPKVHIEAIQKLFASGATIVNIHTGQPDQSKVLQFYGKKVLPQLKGPGSAVT